MPPLTRRVVILVVAAATALASACAPADEASVPIPTREELGARLLTGADLRGDWQVDVAAVIGEDDDGPTAFGDSCEEVAPEPAWQAVTGLTAQGLDPTRTLAVYELVLAAASDEVASLYADLRDQVIACGERQAREGVAADMTEEDLDLGSLGDERFGKHFTAVQVGADSRVGLDQYVVLARDGAVLAAFLVMESIDVGGGTAEVPAGTLAGEDVAAVATTAVSLLTGVVSPLAAPSASGEALGAPVPWWNDAVFYEAFVRSFADSDGDGNGDLPGLIEKLDYLNDGDPATDGDLGVTGLWLMPITESPSYHGYDTTDYRTVEEDYGTNADFRRLVAEAHERGIAVIVDLMLNHTSSEHPWFVDSASGPGAPRRDWYVWRAEDPGTETSWGTPAWHERNGGYYLGLFWEGMPDLNFRTPAVTAEMYDVARFWLEDMGADGFRLDAVRHLVEEGDAYDGGPLTHAWLADWARFVDATAPDALTVGEVWDETPVVAPYVMSGEVDIAFDFDLATAVLVALGRDDPGPLDRTLARVLAAYPPGQVATFLTNHDQDRVMTRLAGDGDRARLAATLLLTLPGVPFVYYGEEIGMTGAKPDELIRTPMQWSSEPHAGFSDATPWEPPNDDDGDTNVAAQDIEPGSLLNLYRRLVHLRTEHPALRSGDLRALGADCPGAYAYVRTAADHGDRVLVLLNLSAERRRSCAFTLADSRIAPGTYAAVDLLTDEAAADLTVADGGGISGYVPVPSLDPRQVSILRLDLRDPV